MVRVDLIKKIKKQIKHTYPNAQIYLFGSRARGDAGKESDWDFLILLDRQVSEKEKLEIRYSLYEIEWESDQVINSVIHSKNEWNLPMMKAMPFHQNVMKEGTLL
ncbi:MAG: nucleotidyltransferase domain-containing protein [Actinobacteria bacterium]|nr:nucleotidyltransferase domain-containing protein [Actinomycetota bacterium]